MRREAHFANTRALTGVRRLLQQLGKAGAVLGRVGCQVVFDAKAANAFIGDAWEALLEYRLHGEYLRISYSVFSGVERDGGIVALSMGVLARLDEAPEDVPRAQEIRDLLLSVPEIEPQALCA